jgi:hypothetical protein
MRKIYLPETETKIIRKALKLYEDALVDVPSDGHLLYDVVTLKNLMNLPVTITVPSDVDKYPHDTLDVDLPDYNTDFLMCFRQEFKLKSLAVCNEFIRRIVGMESMTYDHNIIDNVVNVYAHAKDMDLIQKIYDNIVSKDVSEAQRLRFIAKDIENLVKFIKDLRLGGIFELQDDLGATGWNYISNIEVACDLNNDEPKNWKNEG